MQSVTPLKMKINLEVNGNNSFKPLFHNPYDITWYLFVCGDAPHLLKFTHLRSESGTEVIELQNSDLNLGFQISWNVFFLGDAPHLLNFTHITYESVKVIIELQRSDLKLGF